MSAPAAPLFLASAPYKGLASYTEDDAWLFFGRDRETRVIETNLRAYPLTILYGPTGVGKSSVLRAGVVAQLRSELARASAEGRPLDHLPVLFSSWTSDPNVALRDAIADAAQVFADVRIPTDGALSDTLQYCAEATSARMVVLILDQFEDHLLYSSVDHGGTVDAELPRAIRDPDVPAHFLISLRDDALAGLDRFQGRIPGLFDNVIRIEELDRAGARDAIVGAIDAFNQREPDRPVHIEPDLVDTVLRDVTAVRRGDFGQLPADRVDPAYLQLVMTSLWDTSRETGDQVLRLESLETLGGVEHVVETHLDRALAVLTPDELNVAWAMFAFLVTRSGTTLALSARDLADYVGADTATVAGILEQLASARVVRPTASTPTEPLESQYRVFHNLLAAPILEGRTRRVTARGFAELRAGTRRRLLGFVVTVVAAAFALGIVVGHLLR